MRTKLLRWKSLTFALVMSISGSVSAQLDILNLQGCPIDTLPRGYWIETYNDSINTLTCGDFVFSHLPAGPGASFGGYYWDGFTVGTNGDYLNYGTSCPVQPCDSTHIGSANWVDHQWGVMAGGGIASYSGTTVTSVAKGLPYLIGYWGYHMEPEYYYTMHFGDIPPAPMHCLTMHLADNSTFTPQGVFICNHPWPYWGNRFGDGFARPLNQVGDHFNLIIHGLNSDGDEIGLKRDTLAVYDASAQYGVRQPNNWHWVNLSGIGEGIQTLYFTLETTDADPTYGPNTAVYFCMDKLTVEKDEESASSAKRAKGALQKSTALTIARQATAQVTDEKSLIYPQTFTKSLTVNSRVGGEVLIYNTQGKVVLKTTIKAGRDKIEVSTLPAGKYMLRHGQKNIYLEKK